MSETPKSSSSNENSEFVDLSDQTSEEVAPKIEADVEPAAEELSAAKEKAEKNWELYVRAQAEIENVRRRAEKDLEGAHKFAIEKFASELLGVKDSLELALSSEANDVAQAREGTEITLKMLTQVMEKFNIDVVDPVGGEFDPNLHQAMTMQESSEHKANTVIAVMQKGYILNDRLLRPAMVIVAK